MRSQMARLMVAALVVCFALVSNSSAWARPVSGPESTRAQESPLIENLVDWVLSLIGRHSISPQSPAPYPPRNQPKEGSQMDPNGSPH